MYELNFKVRDYELDLQGIVNNAVYQNYLEHARHEYMNAKGVSFDTLHREGTDAVVVRIEIDYKQPLKSGDEFVCTVSTEREGRLKLIFNQQILRLPDRKLMIQAKVTAACLHNGRPVEPLAVLEKLGYPVK